MLVRVTKTAVHTVFALLPSATMAFKTALALLAVVAVAAAITDEEQALFDRIAAKIEKEQREKVVRRAVQEPTTLKTVDGDLLLATRGTCRSYRDRDRAS